MSYPHDPSMTYPTSPMMGQPNPNRMSNVPSEAGTYISETSERTSMLPTTHERSERMVETMRSEPIPERVIEHHPRQAQASYRLEPGLEPGAGIFQKIRSDKAEPITVVEVRPVNARRFSLHDHYTYETNRPKGRSRSQDRNQPREVLREERDYYLREGAPGTPGEFVHVRERRFEPLEEKYEEDEHRHRRYFLHLGFNNTLGRGGGFLDDRRFPERNEILNTRSNEHPSMLTPATLKGIDKAWYSLENESLADRARYPIRHAGFLQPLNFIAFLGALTISILTVANVWRYSYQEVWDTYFTRFTPAAYSLVAWIVIYAFMLLFAIYQFFPYQRTNLVLFKDISFLFIIACILNILSDLFYGFGWFYTAAGVVTGLLICLIFIYIRVGTGWKKAVAPLEYICVHVLFSLWTGWVSTLVVLYWATAAYVDGWNGRPWTDQGWAILFMCLVVLVAVLLLLYKRDGFFGLAVGWTLIAIAVKNDDYQPERNTFYITGGVLCAVSLLFLVIKFIFWRRECRLRELVILKPNLQTPYAA